MADAEYIGADIPREDSLEKSTGSARYATDFYPKNCLRLKILRSARPHARILSVKTEKARRIAGVEAVVTGQDYPGAFWGSFLQDQTIFAIEKVRCIGEPIAAVAGGDDGVVEEAVESIEIEYEDLPPVFDAREAMSGGAPILHEDLGSYKRDAKSIFPIPGTNICHHFKLRKGDVEEGIRGADFVFEDAYRIPMVQHCSMEPHACVARFETSGKLTLWTSTQGPHLARQQVAGALGLPLSSVRVVAPCCGGAFGGKISACAEVLCAAAAVKLPGRPVRLVFDREEEFGATFVRQEFFAEYKTGVTRDGTLVAREVKLIWDAGASGDYEASVCRTAGHNSPGPYRIPHVRVDSYCVYTNKPKAGAFRGFGVSEVCFCYEQQLDRIAKELGIDPIEIRLKNIVREGDESAAGQVLVGVGLEECLKKVREALSPRERPSRGRKVPKRRGIGIACMMKSTAAHSRSEAEIEVRGDGSILLKTSAIEHGQGSHTVLRQIAAEELCCDPSAVRVIPVDTDVTPYSGASSASKATFFDGNAVRRAAVDAKRQLLETAARLLEANPADLVLKGGKVSHRATPERSIGISDLTGGPHASPVRKDGGPFVGKGDYRVEESPLDPESGQGRVSTFFMFAAQGAEIEVDLETGKLEVLRLIAAHDVGRAISHKGCEGQIEGALIQGLGTALFEELVCDNGALANADFGDYKIPCALDTPQLGPILVEAPNPEGPWGAKGVGEPGLVPTAPAIGNALFQATGCQMRTLPFVPEKILVSLNDTSRADIPR
ncbi:MAG: xanthine dehydrogenase family protein molybdopterin-binding subunit [Nitrospinota bacterium]